MILLTTTSDVLRIVTDAAADVDTFFSFVDRNGTTDTPGNQDAAITTATTTTVVSAPGASTYRNIRNGAIRNKDTISVKVTVEFYDGTNAREVVEVTLAPDASLHYEDGRGWEVFNDGVIVGGSNTQIQFNDNGAFGGDADFTWDSTTKDLVLGGTDTGITLKGITTEPSAPSAGNLHYYSKLIAGRMIPKVVGPAGVDTPLQAALWGNNISLWTPTTATEGVWQGTAGAGAGTYTTALPTTTNLYTAMKRGGWANVVTTTNQVLGQRNTEAMFFIGSTTGQGGFFFFARCGFDVWTNGGRFFAGFHTATTVVSADPSALNNTVGFCVDAADNGAISFLTRSTSATKASTGFTITTSKGYDLYIFCAPNSNTIYWRIVDIVAGTEASGSTTTTTPAANTMLTAGVLASNAALTPVTSIQLGLNRIYVETDR